MSATVVLGIRVVKTDLKHVTIENIDLESKVSVLREHASQNSERPQEDLELIYCGIPLEDNNTLSSYGIKSGRIVHVLEKVHPPLPKVARPITDADLQRFLFAFEEYGHRNILQKFSRPEVMEKILASVPDLVEDPVGIALLQDPELLLLFAEGDNLRKILESHPLLVDALTQIMNYLRENPDTVNANQPTTSTGYSYSLEALSDDEDMDDQPREGHPLSRNSSYNAITAAQLAAAIANATTSFSSTGAVVSNATLTPPSTGNIITNEMFGSALQHAFASASSTATPTAPRQAQQRQPVQEGEESMDSLQGRLQPQLQQMRDMGLVNETQNVRALQVTNGDVQAAIELVFNADVDMSY